MLSSFIGVSKFGRRRVISSNSLVTSNLTLHLDPNNSSSYSGSGTTYTDLAGGDNNITLVGSPTYTSGTPSYFTFNGTNQYGTGSGTGVCPSTAYTKFVWFYLNGYLDNNFVSSGSGGHFMFMGASTNRIYCGHANWNSYGGTFLDYPSTATFNLSTWYCACLTFSTTNGMTLYVNGVQDSTFTAIKNAHGGDGSTNIAQFSGGNLLNGRLGEILCYSSELSAGQVLQNFNTTKSKYGL